MAKRNQVLTEDMLRAQKEAMDRLDAAYAEFVAACSTPFKVDCQDARVLDRAVDAFLQGSRSTYTVSVSLGGGTRTVRIEPLPVLKGDSAGEAEFYERITPGIRSAEVFFHAYMIGHAAARREASREQQGQSQSRTPFPYEYPGAAHFLQQCCRRCCR